MRLAHHDSIVMRYTLDCSEFNHNRDVLTVPAYFFASHKLTTPLDVLLNDEARPYFPTPAEPDSNC